MSSMHITRRYDGKLESKTHKDEKIKLVYQRLKIIAGY
jgi:hypothetical protein